MFERSIAAIIDLDADELAFELSAGLHANRPLPKSWFRPFSPEGQKKYPPPIGLM
jgi:hypothetical protein